MSVADTTEADRPRRASVRGAVGFGFILLALGLAGWAIWHKHAALGDALHRMPIADIAVSWLFGLGSVVATLFIWRSVLAGFGVALPLRESSRVYFIGQLGKYIPGSLWPLLAQMQLARRHGVGRKTMLASGVLAIVINVLVGTVLACTLLPFVSPHALHHFWWLLLFVPFLVAAVHPSIVFNAVNLLLRRMGREQMDERLTVAAELKAAAWGLVSWLCLGVHCYLLVSGLGTSGWHAFAASVAAGCLAVSAGILLIPVPAGAGVREVAYVLTLSSVISSTAALLVALLSRSILITVDVALAGFAWMRGRR